MTLHRSTSLVAIAAALSLFAASPAFAFNWACTAKDSAGTVYEGRWFGLFSQWTKDIAASRAMTKCEASGATSCKPDGCTDLDAQYSQ